MAELILAGVVVLVVGGCGCVFWAERGGPRWARVVAALTLAAAGAVGRSGRKGLGRGGGHDD
ncbi:hypothetical protein [Streptomyces wuyuanensis]|uniref:Uncharacterized protein n=1 Tax=Streptomyces wuyuanensis TaxID=1196353 RepID=A0A1H0A5I0_9ACTN|nr:hypothetical protein [Streptomyces wuyuanensis]SDN28715.1 hypothetical protein SAMN05444921_12395 [Streptomyces wuyuanensis]